jgi:hypothetical protein
MYGMRGPAKEKRLGTEKKMMSIALAAPTQVQSKHSGLSNVYRVSLYPRKSDSRISLQLALV